MSDYKVMASNSIMFYESYKLLKGNLNLAIKNNDTTKMGFYFVPQIVNFSFSVEMALKAILTKEGIAYKKIHKLDELFFLLPNQLQDVVYHATKLKFNYSDDECNTQIAKIGDAFVDWRYFHEKSNSIKSDFFDIFAEIVCQSCYQICKN